MLLHFLLLLFVFLFHLLPLLQLCVFLILILRQFLLLLPVFLIAIRLSLRRAMLRQLRRVAVRRPVSVGLRPVVGTWRPVWIVICPILSRPVALVRRSILVHRPILIGWTIRRISAAIRRRIVVAASLRCHYAASAKRRRSCRSRDRRLAMILRRAQFTIASRRLYVLILGAHRPDVSFPSRCFFLRRCAYVDAAISAVVAHPRNIDVVLDV